MLSTTQTAWAIEIHNRWKKAIELGAKERFLAGVYYHYRSIPEELGVRTVLFRTREQAREAARNINARNHPRVKHAIPRKVAVTIQVVED